MAKKKKNKIQQPLEYSGNVVVKVLKNNRVINSKKYENTATNRLLYGLALYVSGFNLATLRNYQPKYMAVGSGARPNSDFDMATQAVLENQIGIRANVSALSVTPEIVNMNKATATLTSLFTYNDIGENVINEIGLFATSTEATLIARINVDGIELFPGMSLIIEWNLGFENKVV